MRRWKRRLEWLVPPCWRPARLVRRHLEELVASRRVCGLFDGMNYIEYSIMSVWFPKILGTYELEILDVLREQLARGLDRVIDVGAAEGYYAVGFARALPSCRVIAFELEGGAAVEELARRNGVEERVEVRGFCDASALREALGDGGERFVLMDIEGGEALLLDPAIVPELARCSILVEVHEAMVRGVGDLLRRRFAATHEIREIAARPRERGDLPFEPRSYPHFDSTEYYLAELWERPLPMSWFSMVPRSDRGVVAAG